MHLREACFASAARPFESDGLSYLEWQARDRGEMVGLPLVRPRDLARQDRRRGDRQPRRGGYEAEEELRQDLSTIDRQRPPGDVAGLVAGEEERGVSDVRRGTESPLRDAASICSRPPEEFNDLTEHLPNEYAALVSK